MHFNLGFPKDHAIYAAIGINLNKEFLDNHVF